MLLTSGLTSARATASTPPEVLVELDELRTGTLSRLVIHPEPRPIPEHELRDEDDKPTSLGDYRGKVLVVNFWATWCVPCRKEMPALDRLHSALGGESFAVLAINIDRNGLEKSRAFYDEHQIEALAIHVDPGGKFAAATRVLGLPATLLVDAAGNEIGRLTGEAEWDAPEVIEFFVTLLAHTATQ